MLLSVRNVKFHVQSYINALVVRGAEEPAMKLRESLQRREDMISST